MLVNVGDEALDYHKRLLLEAWYFQKDRNTGNEQFYNNCLFDHFGVLLLRNHSPAARDSTATLTML